MNKIGTCNFLGKIKITKFLHRIPKSALTHQVLNQQTSRPNCNN